MSMTVKKIHSHFTPPHSSPLLLLDPNVIVEVLQPRIPHKTSLCCSQSIDQKCHGSYRFMMLIMMRIKMRIMMSIMIRIMIIMK